MTSGEIPRFSLSGSEGQNLVFDYYQNKNLAITMDFAVVSLLLDTLLIIYLSILIFF